MKHSAEKLIENHFRQGLSLTEIRCISLFGRMRLASIAHRLRKKGLNVQGEKSKFGHYFIYHVEP